MSRFRLGIASLAMVFILASKAFGTAPTISIISPSSATAGSASFTLTVTGTYLTPSQTLYWNTTPLAQTYASSMELKATVPSTLLAAAGTVQIKVYTVAGGYSNLLTFSILAPSATTCSTLLITTTSLPPGTTGAAYVAGLQATGGAWPYTWSVRSYGGSEFPPGIIMGPNGSIGGTPTLAGTYSFTAQVKDSANCVATYNYSLSIGAPIPLVIGMGFVPSGRVGTALRWTLTAGGGTPPYSWSVSSGAPPPGLTISTTGTGTGVISGTPTTSGSYSFAVQVKDSNSQSATKIQTITATIGQ